MNRIFISFLVAAFAFVAVPLHAHAEQLHRPSGNVLLTIAGNIDNTNGRGGVAEFDRAMLEDLEQHQVTMKTPWTEGEVSFQGFHIRDLMAMVGAEGREVVATALNDYSASIPIEDFTQRDVLIAMEMNGQPMRVRDKGPLWIIYPVDPGTGELSVVDRDRMVWQLHRLTIQ